ncbi:MAG: leucine-rich repeat domain-containing protein, partial [Lachnospiraceae bacterium]|nr:leucine-rich repeat domain-containing protein [Lachnospiraceae bacterium]
MRIRRFEKSFKKACSVVLAFSMIVTSSALDFNVEYNKDTGVVVTSGKEAKAQSGSVGEDATMANYITDTTLQTYLLGVYKSSVSGADQSKTVSSLKISDLYKITSNLSIPSGVKSVKGLGWVRNTTGIDMSACTQLTEIADDEFSGCKSLVTVELPSSVTKLGGDSFYQCTKLENINLNNVTYIGDNAFASCEVLTDDSYATMKDTLTYLGSGAFNGCKALTTVKVPVLTDSKQAHTVPDSLFQNCERVSKVNFCDSSLEKIGASSFYQTGLVTFKTSADTNYGNTLPKTVKNISSSAFAYSGIYSLDLSANTGLEEIQGYTFQMSYLSEITLPNKLKKIGDNAFEQTLISEIIMPNTVTEIGARCFEWAPCLENVVLSTEITEIPLQCFEGAGNFYARAYDPPTQELYVKYYDAKMYTRRLNISFNGTSKIKTIGRLAFQASAIGQDDFFTQLPALESIGEKSFTYTFLEKVTFPASLKEMGATTFGGSYFLEEVNFPEDSKLTELPERAFGYTGDAPSSAYAEICPSLKKVTLPDKLEIIGKNCFRACLQLKTVGRNSSIEANKVILDGPIKDVQDGAFANCAAYENAEEDRNYAKQILLDSDAKSNGVDEEKCSMIIEPTGISEVILSSEGSKVDMTFGSGVFEGDKMLEKVTTYDGAKELGKSMFLNCGSYVDSVSESEFYKEYLADVDYDYEGDPMEFVGLKEVYLSKFTKTIGESAFSGCYNLSTFNDVNGTCPKALETIGNSAFSKCKSLTKVTINSNLKSIGNSAFAECS